MMVLQTLRAVQVRPILSFNPKTNKHALWQATQVAQKSMIRHD